MAKQIFAVTNRSNSFDQASILEIFIGLESCNSSGRSFVRKTLVTNRSSKTKNCSGSHRCRTSIRCHGVRSAVNDGRKRPQRRRKLIEQQATGLVSKKIEQFLVLGKFFFFAKQACGQLPFEGIGYPQKIRRSFVGNQESGWPEDFLHHSFVTLKKLSESVEKHGRSGMASTFPGFIGSPKELQPPRIRSANPNLRRRPSLSLCEAWGKRPFPSFSGGNSQPRIRPPGHGGKKRFPGWCKIARPRESPKPATRLRFHSFSPHPSRGRMKIGLTLLISA